MKKVKNIIRKILFVISLILFLVSGYLLIQYYTDIKGSENIINDLKDFIVVPEYDKQQKRDYSDLYKQNNDFVGWLKIDGTVIDYPVMQTKSDEQFYLHRNFNKEYNYSGSLFCNAASDVEKPSDNIVIYGHHMNANTMFHCLDEYEKEDFYKEHKYIIFDTLKYNAKYEVIAAYRTDVNPGSYEYWKFVDGTEEEFNKYISFAKDRTPYKIDSTAEYGDKLITLSTCAYHVQNGRFVVVAKRIDYIE